VRSVSAGELEGVVIQELRALFRSPERLITRHREDHPDDADGLRILYNAVFSLQQLDHTWEGLYPVVQQRIVRLLVETVTVYPDRVDVRIRLEGLNELGQESAFREIAHV